MRNQKELACEAGLNSENMRLLQRARDLFGVEELNAETALQAARNIREQLSELPSDVRLTRQNNILALMDDLNSFREELRDEKQAVEMQISKQVQNKKANVAYMTGAISCPSK